jgi:hypothetical protein
MVLRSALIPGWGQIAGGAPRSGAFLLGSTAVLLPAGAFLSSLRDDAAQQAARAQSQARRSFLNDRANVYRTGAIAAFAVAGTLYGFGIANAASTAPRYYAGVTRSGLSVAVSLPMGPRRVGKQERSTAWAPSRRAVSTNNSSTSLSGAN